MEAGLGRLQAPSDLDFSKLSRAMPASRSILRYKLLDILVTITFLSLQDPE